MGTPPALTLFVGRVGHVVTGRVEGKLDGGAASAPERAQNKDRAPVTYIKTKREVIGLFLSVSKGTKLNPNARVARPFR